MQTTRFDFDVITGPAPARPAPAPKPKPDEVKGELRPDKGDVK